MNCDPPHEPHDNVSVAIREPEGSNRRVFGGTFAYIRDDSGRPGWLLICDECGRVIIPKKSDELRT